MEKKNNVFLNDFVIDGNDVWFVHRKLNALIQYNLSTQSMCDFIYLRGEFNGEYTFMKLFKIQEKVILIPNQCRHILVIDVLKKKIDRIPIVDPQYNIQIYGVFRTAINNGNKILALPSHYSYICEIDIESRRVDNLFNWRTFFKISDDTSFVKACSVAGNNVYMLIAPSNKIVSFDWQSQEADEIKLTDVNDVEFISMVAIEKNIYLNDLNKNIYKIDIENGRNKGVLFSNLSDGVAILSKIGTKVILDSVYANKYNVYDENFNLCFGYSEEADKEDTQEKDCRYLICNDHMKYREYCVYFNNSTSEFHFWNNGLERKIPIDISEFLNEFITCFCKDDLFFTEGDAISLNEWLVNI